MDKDKKQTKDGKAVSSTKLLAEFEKVRMTNATVNQGLKADLPLEQIIVFLAKTIDDQWHRISELELIAPRKIELEDGRVMIKHLSDDLVPLS